MQEASGSTQNTELECIKQNKKMLRGAFSLLTFLVLVSSSPIYIPDKAKDLPGLGSLPKGFCFLPSEQGEGLAVHVEDCNNLGEVKKHVMI